MASKKAYPTVRTSQLFNSTGSPQNHRVVLVDRMLSKLNRRLYRQGRFYEVKIDIDPTQASTVQVYALRNDWAVHKAYQMAYREYLENTSQERANLSSNMIARWEDFKVSHGTTGADISDPALLNGAGVAVGLTSGEFNLANVVDSSGARKSFTWGTPGGSEYGILQEYDKSANTPVTPPVVSNDAPYVELDSEVNELTHDDLQGDNNSPPYAQNDVSSGTPFVKIAELKADTANGTRLSTGFFTAPCGIVLIQNVGAAGNDLKISMTAKSGDYKGVHAPSMLE